MPDADWTKQLFSAYDVTSTSYIYGTLSEVIQSPKYLITDSSASVVSELNTGDDAFAGFGVGDIIYVNVDGTWANTTVTGATDIPTHVTVGTAKDWQNGTAGRAFSFRRFASGTAATDGWFPVGEFTDKSVSVNITTINATSVSVTIEAQVAGSAALTLYPKTYTAVGTDVFVIPENVTALRVGFKVDTATGVQSVSAVFKGAKR